MAFKIEDKFQVKAPVERVWAFLMDPQQAVQCLPGVKLTQVEDPKNFLGTMAVKIGPVTMSFQGKVQITEMDEKEHRVRMTGEGKEGGGWVKGSMSSQVASVANGSEVTVQSELEIAGRALQFGRSLVESIMKQQFKKFAECVQKKLES